MGAWAWQGELSAQMAAAATLTIRDLMCGLSGAFKSVYSVTKLRFPLATLKVLEINIFHFLDIDTQNIGFTYNLNVMLLVIASILVDYSLGLAGIFCG